MANEAEATAGTTTAEKNDVATGKGRYVGRHKGHHTVNTLVHAVLYGLAIYGAYRLITK